jgi:UPF0755 protein
LKKTFAIFATAAFLLTLAATTLLLELLIYADRPAGNDTTPKTITISSGQNFNSVSKDLHQQGLIQNRFKLRLLARVREFDKSIKAGEYQLNSSMTPVQVLTSLVKGKTLLYRLTVPEGYNLKEIARLVDREGFTSEERFLQAAAAPELMEKMGIRATTLEGYLFPDTYFLPRPTSPGTIISAMVKRFNSVFSEKWEKRALEIKFTRHQAVTLAAIIEKETGEPSERAMISSVFHNRLKRRMRLETDPTVIYGIKDFDGNLTRKHLSTPTPYNTYIIKGLPPGPIANPGAEAIKAALYPATTDLLFFVSKKNRTHAFSSNIKDHNRAVRKYQLRK